MESNKHQREEAIDKIRILYKKTQGGIFRNTTREKIITKEGISGRDIKRDQFWYKQRENVKTALIDLQLFIEEAGHNNVNQVVKDETLKPIVAAILKSPYPHDPDLKKAEIARLFILAGFNYLALVNRDNVTLSHKRTIDEAIDLSDYLVESLKPKSERRYPSYVGM